MESLQEIYERNIKNGFPDKGTTHSYIEVYEKLFEQYRFGFHTILEIGIFSGQSLRMWEQYFSSSKVIGIDCDEQPHGGAVDLRPMIAEGTHNIVIMDATDPIQVRSHFGNMKFDIILDDASHVLAHQVFAYTNFKSLLNPNGLYIIEDIQDLDKDRNVFECLADNVEILDRRIIKNRFDDVMVIIR